MKKYLFLLVVFLQSLLLSAPAAAAACTSGAIGSYTALGVAGCTIGSLTFSNFVVRPSASEAIASSAIAVTPTIAGATIAGLTFTVSPTASGGNYFDDLITYTVTGIAANLIGSTVDFTGSGTTGDAAVSVAEQLCLAGTFAGADGVSGCTTGPTQNLAVVNIFGVADPAYSLAFSPSSFLSVVSDIAYDSGSGFDPSAGSTLTAGINLFSYVGVRAVPEPASALLIAIGVLGLALSQRKASRRRD